MSEPVDKRSLESDATAVSDSLVKPQSISANASRSFGETLPLPDNYVQPTRPDERTENLSVPPATQGGSILDQTLNEPSESSAADTAGRTRVVSLEAAVRRRALVDSETSPLSAGGGIASAPVTRHGSQAAHPHDRTLMPSTDPVGHEDARTRWPLIPGYVILSELGRGGMGVVYKARQTKLNRIVALKMIRAGANAGNEDLRRFKAEAEAVARLQHQHIVQIYEIGEIEGMPFFSLEYIDGGSLHQRLAKDTGMPAREAAALVETLGRAMDYAHEQGIIHRDLKPANIMLQSTKDEGKRKKDESRLVSSSSLGAGLSQLPKITDFGLAKKLDEKDTGQTREGSILGTPSYMAPEQAQGKTKEMGPAADIYALGAILYDLLASRPPFRGETLMDTLHQVINTDPMPPRHLQPNCPRDLDIICLKCLEKDPKKRYLSAGELADDLRRFLNHEPILARAAPWWEKAGKWAKRRPAAASLLLFAMLTILALLGGSSWYAAEQTKYAAEQAEQRRVEERLRKDAEEASQRAMAEAERAERASLIALREQARAESRERDARKAVDTLFTRLADERLENVPQLQPLRKALYEDARSYQKRFLRDNRADPRLKEELAFGERQLGLIEEKLGNPRAAEEAYSTALELFEELIKTDAANFDYRLNFGIVADKLAITAQKNQKAQRASDSFDRSILELTTNRQRCPEGVSRLGLIAAAIAGPLQPAELRWNSAALLVATDTLERKTEETLYSLGDAHLHRANFRQVQKAGKPNRDSYLSAHQDCEAALAVFEILHRLQPGNPLYQEKLGVARGGFGLSLLNGGDVANGVKRLEEGMALIEPLTRQHPLIASYRSDFGTIGRNLATVHFLTAPAGPAGDKVRDKALAEVRLAAEALSRLAEDFDSVPEYREELAQACKATGIFTREMKMPVESLKAWQAGIRALEKLERTDEIQDQLGTFYEELARAWVAQVMPRFDEAADAWQKSIDLYRQLVRDNPNSTERWRKLLDRHFNRVLVFRTLGRTAEAVKFAEERTSDLDARRAHFGNQPALIAEVASSLHQWALLLRERGQSQESDKKLSRSIELQREMVAAVPQEARQRRALCIYLLAAKDHQGVQTVVKAWEQQLSGPTAELHEAAWCLACLLTLTENMGIHSAYASEAVRLLEKAASLGFRDARFLERKEFDLLRMRADFKKLAIR